MSTMWIITRDGRRHSKAAYDLEAAIRILRALLTCGFPGVWGIVPEGGAS